MRMSWTFADFGVFPVHGFGPVTKATMSVSPAPSWAHPGWWQGADHQLSAGFCTEAPSASGRLRVEGGGGLCQVLLGGLEFNLVLTENRSSP